jgi:hypothetical protein
LKEANAGSSGRLRIYGWKIIQFVPAPRKKGAGQ